MVKLGRTGYETCHLHGCLGPVEPLAKPDPSMTYYELRGINPELISIYMDILQTRIALTQRNEQGQRIKRKQSFFTNQYFMTVLI